MRIYSDVENKQVKSDSIVNKVLTFFNNKTGNKISLNEIDENTIKKNILVERIFRFAENKLESTLLIQSSSQKKTNPKTNLWY